MREISLFGLKAEIDEERTKIWYENAYEWGCECGDCMNFLSIADKGMLPDEVIEVLNSLHISPKKATYVCSMYPNGDKYCYQFSYRICGVFDETVKNQIKTNWGMVNLLHELYPYGAPNFPEPHFDLDFWVDFPRILNK